MGQLGVTTVFLGKLIELYLIAISLGMLANRRRTLDTLDEMAPNGPWMQFSGMAATAGGLALVIGHQVWSGGVLSVLVTITGWSALLKGLALLLVPGDRIAAAYMGAGLERWFGVWMAVALLFGLWMSWLAFTP